MKYLNLVWNFLVKSSADPKKASLTVKAFGVMLVTVYTAQVIPAVQIACEMGYLCELVDPSVLSILNNLIDLASQIVYYALMLASIAAAFVGTVRKSYRTLTGTNLAITDEA